MTTSNISEQEIREDLLALQLKIEKTITEAQNIVLKHLELSIESGDSATVAAMAEILKI